MELRGIERLTPFHAMGKPSIRERSEHHRIEIRRFSHSGVLVVRLAVVSRESSFASAMLS